MWGTCSTKLPFWSMSSLEIWESQTEKSSPETATSVKICTEEFIPGRTLSVSDSVMRIKNHV